MKLATVLTSTEVASTIDLYAGTPAGSVRGMEELRTLKFSFQGRTGTLPVGDLLERTVPLMTLGAEWDGTQSGADVLAIDPHEFALRFGKMILWVADNVLQEAGATSLSQAAAYAINCAAITSAITTARRRSRSASASRPFPSARRRSTGGCTIVPGVVKDKALGLFDVDAGVELGVRCPGPRRRRRTRLPIA